MIADPRIGTQLASYRIESLIGRGGMSVVYLATDVRLKRKVALKLLSPELGESERFRERFVRESELAASLDHPNIIPIFEAGESDGVAYIAMRYVQGTDLGVLIEAEGHLEPERTIRLLAQAASALDAAHSGGLIHRDVKPGNMLIASGTGSGGQEHLYLSDFGVTKRSTSDSGLTGTGQLVGTLDYAAPEQFEGKALDARTDTYSLGCVLYECLTGKIPFQRDTQAALVYAHLMASPPKVTETRPELPEAIDEVVARAMAKDPEGRHSSAGELVEAAREVLAPTAVVASSEAPAPSLRRRRVLIAGGAALVAAVPVLVAVLLGRGGGGTAVPSISPSAGALAALDRVIRISQAGSQASLAKLRPLKVGRDPSAVAVGEGSVWVANAGDGTVSRIDPVKNETAATIKVGSRPSAIAFGEGSIWVINRLSRSISRIDPGQNRVVATIELNAGGFPSAIAAGEGGVWVGVDQVFGGAVPPPAAIHRIDPRTNRDVATIPTKEINQFWIVVTTAEGAVWTAGDNGLLARIDPETNRSRKVASLSIPAGAITVGDGALWIASERGGILRVDPATGRIDSTVPGGGSHEAQFEGPDLGMSFANGIVWVTGRLNGTIDRILASGNTPLEPIRVGPIPTDVAVGYGSVWVTVDATG